MREHSVGCALFCGSGIVQILVLMFALGCAAQTGEDAWLLLASGQSGTINARTTWKDLVKKFGAANVVDQDVDVGEGETEPGTTVYPKDPKRRIEIIWKNQAERRDPSSVRVNQAGSRWKALHNISIGTSLKELERINGRPFRLAGFQWDYSGTVLSWDGGALDKEFKDKGRVLLRLDPPWNENPSDKDLSQLGGDRDFSSQNPLMQRFNPRVYEMIWVFPE